MSEPETPAADAPFNPEEAPPAGLPEPDPFAPVLVQPIGPVRFSAPCVIEGVRVPPGERLRVTGSVRNDGEFVVSAWDAGSVSVVGEVRDEPAGQAADLIIHWLPQDHRA